MMIFLSLPIPLANPGEPGTASRDEAKKTGSGFRVDWTPSAPGPGTWAISRSPPAARIPHETHHSTPGPGGAVAGDPAGGAHLHPPIGGPEPAAGQRFHEAPKAPRPAVPRFGRGCHLQWTASSGYAARARRSRYARPNHNSAPTQPAEMVLREQHQRPSLDDKSNTLHLLFVSPPLEQRLFA
ncbi:hypothetical protein ACCO45_009226 [Purpureocillium lilacinum]|uniref:Uncharacterized protein n=1 Tax=Purpureocillium lilacinum TaxID=33203 RepID=A0ACC4DJ68_PURLI